MYYTGKQSKQQQHPKQHHPEQKSVSLWTTSTIWIKLFNSRNVPYIFASITILPCLLLIWHSLHYTKFNPNQSFYEVYVGTNLFQLSNQSNNITTASIIPDRTRDHDSETITNDVLTLFLQEDLSSDTTVTPKITKLEFPKLGMTSCLVGSHNNNTNTIVLPKLPIDEYPNVDPYLPWIHDYHINYPIANEVRFVAQNRRRCYTGVNMESNMKFWEPQMSLFQPVSVQEEEEVSMDNNNTTMQYRLTSMDNATYKETRFVCHFHSTTTQTKSTDGNAIPQNVIHATTLSTYFFNYEYVAWRKGGNYLPMYKLTGKDVSNFLLSQLLFKCPIPSIVRDTLLSTTVRRSNEMAPIFYLDVIPIRTPPRYTKLPMVTMDMVGPNLYGSLSQDKEWLNVVNAYSANNDRIVPEIEKSGRYANLPLCGPASTSDIVSHTNLSNTTMTSKQFHFVACTWTSASYHRRGDKTVIDDASSRLLEWIIFHKLVGIDHIYLYDNTQMIPGSSDTSPLQNICRQFPDYVTYIPWPASICNNNRPNHKNPGERSSQYAAEASCRSRFGDLTDWMTFIDTDEYIVPMMQQQQSHTTTVNGNRSQPNLTTWHEVLHEMEKKGYYILKMPSSRGRPRLNLMEELSSDIPNSAVCVTNDAATQSDQRYSNNNISCLVPRRNETYLRVYNCDYIRHPRPHRFLRAMKQIYRPAYVFSHFVHYSAATADMAKYYTDYPKEAEIPYPEYIEHESIHEHVLDELTEGVLIHAKTVLPHETMTRAKSCYLNSTKVCSIGYTCHRTTPFDDVTHTKNVFKDLHGNYCNCWIDEYVENYWIPVLETSLEYHK